MSTLNIGDSVWLPYSGLVHRVGYVGPWPTAHWVRLIPVTLVGPTASLVWVGGTLEALWWTWFCPRFTNYLVPVLALLISLGPAWSLLDIAVLMIQNSF